MFCGMDYQRLAGAVLAMAMATSAAWGDTITVYDNTGNTSLGSLTTVNTTDTSYPGELWALQQRFVAGQTYTNTTVSVTMHISGLDPLYAYPNVYLYGESAGWYELNNPPVTSVTTLGDYTFTASGVTLNSGEGYWVQFKPGGDYGIDGSFTWSVVSPNGASDYSQAYNSYDGSWGSNPISGGAFQLKVEAQQQAVPEIDPAGIGSVMALVTGALGLLERRRAKIT